MAYDFKGKNILVTGAGRNIGRGIAVSLVKQGAKVFALDCIQENLDNLVKEYPDIQPVCKDLENWDEVKNDIDQLGSFDGLVNCAAVLCPPEKAVDVPLENLMKCVNVNLLAAINLMQVVGKKMIEAGKGGSIVNISSQISIHAVRGLLPYCTAKAGLDMATKIFALELGAHKIRVNSVNPGPVNTEMLLRSVGSADKLEHFKEKTPVGRLTEISDVADLVSFLLSDHSLMINGTTNLIDGGHSCQLP